MSEWLLNISGPLFLLFFIVICTVTTAICWYFFDGSINSYSMPDKNKIEPLTLAVLRDGWKAAIDVSVIQLIQRKVIGIKKIDGKEMLYINRETAELSKLETIVYDYLIVPKSRSSFKGTEIKSAINICLQPIYRELEKLHLLKKEDELRLGMWRAIIIIIGLELLAVTKFNLGVMHQRPVGFLVVTMVLTPIVIWKILRPRQLKTRLGRKYITTVGIHFNWLRDKLSKCKQRSGNADYALGVAIFGIGILQGGGFLRRYQLFAQSNAGVAQNSSIADGGCFFDDGHNDGGGNGCGGCGGS